MRRVTVFLKKNVPNTNSGLFAPKSTMFCSRSQGHAVRSGHGHLGSVPCYHHLVKANSLNC